MVGEEFENEIIDSMSDTELDFEDNVEHCECCDGVIIVDHYCIECGYLNL